MKNIKLTIKLTQALMISCLLIGTAVFAENQQGKIEVKSEAFKLVESVDEKGKKTVKRIKAEDASIIPKDTILYITTVTNISDTSAENIVVKNPISDELIYVDGSAEGKATEITYSVNKGASFHEPENIVIKNKNGKTSVAQAKDYNAIQWVYLPKLKAGQKTTMSFKAILGKGRI